MSSLLTTVAPYVPVTLTRSVLASPSIPSEPSSDRLPAAILFADVSHFTSLTERLVRNSAEGPEVLTCVLDRFYGRVVALIEAEGGDVVKFGGDALTALFADRDEPLGRSVRRAKQAADAMQVAMTEMRPLYTRAGEVALNLRIGIGAGEAQFVRVGGVADRWECAVAGEALDQALRAQYGAAPGDVALSPEAAATMWDHALMPRPLLHPDWSAVQDVDSVQAHLLCYLPRPIQGWLQRDLHEWLAVLHPMSVLFVGMRGLDYATEEAVARLHAALRAVLETVYRYEGMLARLSVDDKGTAMLVLFGAPPFAHEDDPERAVRCALDVCSALGTHGAEGFSGTAGLASGHVLAGPVGGAGRREYTAMGNAVNLAARLMGKGEPGQVLCDYDTFRVARSACEFESVAPVRVKGRAGPIRVYRPTGRVSVGREGLYSLTGRSDLVDWDPRTLLGREHEVSRLESALQALLADRGRVVILQGEAGIGKSRLVIELTRLARERGLTWLAGAGRSVEQQTPYFAWRDVFSYYFGISESSNTRMRRDQVEAILGDLLPDQAHNAPLLNDVLNLGVPETDSGVQDPGVRRQQLNTLLVALLRAWSREQPLILVLEDAHWLDSLSWELAVRVAEDLVAEGEPILLVLALRPVDVHDGSHQHLDVLRGLERTDVLLPGSLPSSRVRSLAAAVLGLPDGDLPGPIASLLEQRAGGNPLFVQELVYALRDQGLVKVLPRSNHRGVRCTVSEDLDHASRALPETVHGLVLSRIDRLEPAVQLTLKVASVIGRVFAYHVLRHTLARYTPVTDEALRRQVEQLSALELTPLSSHDPELSYRFKHAITQEVAYQTLLFAQRRAVHRAVAEALEKLYPQRIEEMVGLLAHHWDRAEYSERAVGYLLRAGKQAQRVYASKEAIAHYTRALELVDELSDRDLLQNACRRWRLGAVRGLGEVRFGLGELAEANRLFRQAVELGQEGGSDRGELLRLYHWLGEVLWWQAQPDQHMAVANDALELLGTESDTIEAALVNQTVATARLANGDWDGFQDFTMRTAQFIRRLPYSEELRPAYTHIVSVQLNDRDSDEAMEWIRELEDRAAHHQDLRALAEVHMYAGIALVAGGSLVEGLSRWERAAELFGQLEDVKHESWCFPQMSQVLIALGRLEQARECTQKGLETSEVVGIVDHLLLAWESMGLIALCQGRYQEAEQSLEECLQLSREARDLVGQSRAELCLGFVSLAQGDLGAASDHLENAVSTLVTSPGGRAAPGQLSLALSALERAMGYRAFRELCAGLQAEHGGRGIANWLLSEADAGLVPQLARGEADPFDGDLPPEWSWRDPLGDSRLVVRDGLAIRAANGRDLYLANTSAPRVVRPVRGDFAVQVVCTRELEDRPAIGGILLWADTANYLRLAWGTRGQHEISFGGCLQGKDLVIGRGSLARDVAGRAPERVVLRVACVEGRVRAFCGLPGEAWLSVGETACPAGAALEVGLVAVGAIDRLVYPGAYREGTAIRFEGWSIWNGLDGRASQ